MLRVELLPAEQGDAIWIEYGRPSDPHRVLIDGGVRKTYEVVKARAQAVPGRKRRLELLVVTHVDSDHIGGVPKLLADTSLRLGLDEVWFNAWRHLPKTGDRLGPVEGEMVSAELDQRRLRWNTAFDERAVVVPAKGSLPRRELPGGLVLTLLSPTPDRLEALRPAREKAVRDAGLEPGVQDAALEEAARRRGVPDLLGAGLDVDALAASRLEPDTAPANGSTIALLAEYEGSSCLFGGDAHPDVLQAGVERLCRERRVERLAVGALKVPHHGSMFNVSTPLLALIETDRYLFSTSGRQTHHPHPEAVARTILQGRSPTLYFNYRAETTACWDDRRLTARYRYRTVYPDGPGPGLVVEL